MSYTHIDPRELVTKLSSLGEDEMIVDVREPHEWEYYHLDEAVLLPMNAIPGRLDELPSDKTLYVVCAHGVRSEMVSRYLAERGYDRVVNVTGGMAAVAAIRGFEYD
ncbi:rhodanese-like domain-containing protein [Paenibacillus flagellatus]|uniref:Sulfurtransferase n=1 Tax=Paenibacillus flagellatus TaxID=2211139 RepID=A0A2V5K6H1_9BACL|nr:rhodanese-like domain-containing protein [Paenibacillus flagellatus]PYI54971.1 sulfurtransferase [Paenibacillus flagellatus]